MTFFKAIGNCIDTQFNTVFNHQKLPDNGMKNNYRSASCNKPVFTQNSISTLCIRKTGTPDDIMPMLPILPVTVLLASHYSYNFSFNFLTPSSLSLHICSACVKWKLHNPVPVKYSKDQTHLKLPWYCIISHSTETHI